jgi:hypothetical protein
MSAVRCWSEAAPLPVLDGAAVLDGGGVLLVELQPATPARATEAATNPTTRLPRTPTCFSSDDRPDVREPVSTFTANSLYRLRR